jgi:heme/copper-type cytochrome/quinol oxidase subunit 2
MLTAILVLSAVMAVLPVLVWIGFMIWAARRDGEDEDEFKRTHPPS